MPQGPKLRAPSLSSPFHIALIEPEIPPNTGAVARTCAATGSPLHLVGELGFQIDAQAVRRAGLDYWPLVDLKRHPSWASFEETLDSKRFHLFSSEAPRSYLDIDFKPGDVLVFGKESTGLDRELLARYPEQTWGIPTLGKVRSLNLSNAVGIVLYEALRKSGSLEGTFIEE